MCKDVFVPADKTTNFYTMSTHDYKALLKKNIKKEYKKVPPSSEHNINIQAKIIAQDLELDDRIEKLAPKNAFISLKDHKDNFANNPTCRLINPSKSEIGRVSKELLDRINKTIVSKTGIHQWKNTKATLHWFRGIQNKTQCSFIAFDTVNFYPCISQNLLNEALKFASIIPKSQRPTKKSSSMRKKNRSSSTTARPGRKRTPTTRLT